MSDTTATIPAGRLARIVASTRGIPAQTLTRRLAIELAFATALYFGFACYQTWPLVTDLAHDLYGAAGDPYGAIAFFRELVAHHHNPFLPGSIAQFAAPEGQAIPWPRDIASAPEILSLYLLTALFGSIQAYGLNTLAGYTLTGVSTFLLARRLTGNTWASLIAGWTFAFYPFAALNGQAHPDGISGWVIVLALWRLLELLWHPTRRNALFAALAVIFSMWWSPYFILFIGITYFVVTLTTVAIAVRDGNIRMVLRPQLITAALVVIFLVSLVALSSASPSEDLGVRTHSTQELAGGGAKPLQYLLPDDHSPLFGQDTRHHLEAERSYSPAYEDTLYLGITVILLALTAFVAFMRHRLTPKLSRAVLVLWVVAIAALITSFPPEPLIFGIPVPFPAHFIALVTTTWRVYSRLVMVVMLALTLLSAIGLDALAHGRQARNKILIMLCATLLVPLDLWDSQAGHVERIVTPPIYRALAKQPMGLVAQYPLSQHEGTYEDLFFQNTYGKPLINGYLEDTFQAQRALSLYSLANPTTASRLATLGVKYVLVDSKPYGLGWQSKSEPGHGFHLIAREAYASLYLVTAHPGSTALASAGPGFSAVAFLNGQLITRLQQPRGVIELAGSCNECRGHLSMALSPHAVARQITVLDSRGHVLARGLVSTVTKVTIPLHFHRTMTLTLAATPAPADRRNPILKIPNMEMYELEFVSRQAGQANETHRPDRPS